MKLRIAALIISVLTIFTACSEQKIKNTADKVFTNGKGVRMGSARGSHRACVKGKNVCLTRFLSFKVRSKTDRSIISILFCRETRLLDCFRARRVRIKTSIFGQKRIALKALKYIIVQCIEPLLPCRPNDSTILCPSQP